MGDIFDVLSNADEAARDLLNQRDAWKRSCQNALKERDAAEAVVARLRGELDRLRERKSLDDSERRELEKLRAFRFAVDRAYTPTDGPVTATSFGAVPGVGGVGGAGSGARITYS